MRIVMVALFMGMALQGAVERARTLARNGHVAEAMRLLEAHTRHAPSAPALALLAELQAAAGRIPQAAETLGRTLELAPEQHGLRITRGAMLFELRRFDDARRDLERAARNAPGAPMAHYYLAAVLQAAGELEAAESSAERAIALLPPLRSSTMDGEHPPAAAARHLLAEIRFERGASPESALRDVLAIEPLHAQARYLLARTLLASGRADEAHVELQRFEALERAEEHVALARHLAGIEGAREAAIEELQRAIEAYPDHGRALALLGRELLRAGRRDEAIARFERARSLRPELEEEIRRLLTPGE